MKYISNDGRVVFLDRLRAFSLDYDVGHHYNNKRKLKIELNCSDSNDVDILWFTDEKEIREITEVLSLCLLRKLVN